VVGIRKTGNLFPEDKVLIRLLYLQFALVENQMYIDLYKCVAFRLSHMFCTIYDLTLGASLYGVAYVANNKSIFHVISCQNNNREMA